MNLLKHIAQTWKTIRSGGGSLTQSWLRGEDIADGARWPSNVIPKTCGHSNIF